jgi:hypothetical protein
MFFVRRDLRGFFGTINDDGKWALPTNKKVEKIQKDAQDFVAFCTANTGNLAVVHEKRAAKNHAECAVEAKARKVSTLYVVHEQQIMKNHPERAEEKAGRKRHTGQDHALWGQVAGRKTMVQQPRRMITHSPSGATSPCSRPCWVRF